MAKLPYEILSKKRADYPLDEEDIRAIVAGATDESWSDAQLAAFLMAAAIHGLDDAETHHLTISMLESGDQWDLASEIPNLVDKHSTGGVGDKVSLVLAPLLAACDIPVVMLTGRALGHTAGTADKLEVIPGLDLGLDRQRSLELLESTRLASGIATDTVAPADRHLYRIRDQTATVESIPLIVASILSKKLATGASALVFDVKTGNGAFMIGLEEARELAGLLARVSVSMGRQASSLITDMSQPLGDWVGHRSELHESIECLEGRGAPEIIDVSIALAEELIGHIGSIVTRDDLEAALNSGRAKEAFERWALAQGADSNWMAQPDLTLAPLEVVIEAPRTGFVKKVDTRSIGLLMVEAGAGRATPTDEIDDGVSFKYQTRLGQRVEAGQELARLYLRREAPSLTTAFLNCFEIGDEASPRPLILERIAPVEKP
jgi:pyrimidine-nucleoside phosphorylase